MAYEKLWKVLVLKYFAISKIVHLSIITTVPYAIMNSPIQKRNFIWNGKNPKVKHSTLSNSYKDGGLKDIDIFIKVIIGRCLS